MLTYSVIKSYKRVLSVNPGPDTELSVGDTEASRAPCPGRAWSPSKAPARAQHKTCGTRTGPRWQEHRRGHSSSCAGTPAFGKVFCAERWVLSWSVKVHQPTDLRPGFFHMLPLSLAKLIQPRVLVSWIASPKTGIHKRKCQGRNTVLQRTWVLYEKPHGSLTGQEAVRVRDQAARAGVWRCHFLPWGSG